MENNEKKNHSLIDLMDASMSKIREMVDSNTIIGVSPDTQRTGF